MAVLTVSVASEVDFTLKSTAADLAREWFEACMLATVRDKVRRLTK